MREKRRFIVLPLLLLVWIVADQFLHEAGYNQLRLYLTRVLVLLTVGMLVAATWRGFVRLWSQEGSGFNLAVWRIIFFGFFIAGFFVFGKQHVEKALLATTHLPDSARVPLPFYGSLIHWIPVSETLSKIGIYAILLSSFFAMIGLGTRWAIAFFTLAMFYVLGVTQLFGKVNHNHYLVWFPAVLIFSGCGDVLSVDCWLKRKRIKLCVASEKKMQYGRAFGGTWLLTGIIYFFPGFQKLWQSGIDWVFSNNLYNIVMHKSLELPGWQPIIDPARFQILMMVMALFTIVFEFGFVFLIPNPKLRKIAVLAGLLFHLGTWFMLHIFFQLMVLAYLTFIDWEQLLGLSPGDLENTNASTANTRFTSAIVVVLLGTNIWCGFFNIHTWPVSCFPTFASMPGNRTEALEFEEVKGTKGFHTIPLQKFQQAFPAERFRALELRAINLYREQNMQDFRELVGSFRRAIGSTAAVRVYLVVVRWDKNKITRTRAQNPIMELN